MEKCPSISELIDYIERNLCPERRKEIKKHLGLCGKCRDFLQKLTKTEKKVPASTSLPEEN
ncbi:MAG: hypothetical protein KAK00_03165 [Nanoarchaeota archaeon]|nr:hypothetical protein [Nanoarchaeota archaeon]